MDSPSFRKQIWEAGGPTEEGKLGNEEHMTVTTEASTQEGRQGSAVWPAPGHREASLAGVHIPACSCPDGANSSKAAVRSMCFAVPWSCCSVPNRILTNCVTLSKALTVSELTFLGHVETVISLLLGQVQHSAPWLARQSLPWMWLSCLALRYCCPSSPLSVTLHLQKLPHSLCSSVCIRCTECTLGYILAIQKSSFTVNLVEKGSYFLCRGCLIPGASPNSPVGWDDWLLYRP